MASTARDRLIAAHEENPRLNQTEIAEKIGVSRQRVSQLVSELRLDIAQGPRGIGGRGGPATLRRPSDAIVAPPGATADVGVLIAAADLARRGYDVFLPVTKNPQCDLVTIDQSGRVEQVAVTKAKRAGGEVRYDTPENERRIRRALILTDEPVQYAPALREKK